MIKKFNPRLYQQTIFSTASLRNTLVVLPTGLGKTNIFLMLAAYRLKQYPDSKVLLIGPTRPLIHQYYEVFKEYFEINEKDLAIFTGQVSPSKRQELWKKSKIIFSTPQGLENDIISNRISLSNVSLLGVDEAHRAVKDYAYVWVAKRYMQESRFPRILGLTASPGSDKDKIQEVCNNLFIEEIEIRNQDSPDVREYVKDIKIKYEYVELSKEILEVRNYLKEFISSRINEIKNYGYVKNISLDMSKKDLLGIQGHLIQEMTSGNKEFNLLKSLSVLTEILKVSYALELIDSQGINPLYKYLNEIIKSAHSSKVKAVKNIVKDINFRSASIKTERLIDKAIEHPKLTKLKEILSKIRDKKIIIFTQYRDTALEIKDKIELIEGINAKIFVGQMKKKGLGLSQKEQIKIINEFREGKFNILIMTSVGEEGLDIPRVDEVIFYEPVPSVIRFIQRRGRTGRQEEGKVRILVTKGTLDEIYMWASRRREKKMYDNIFNIKRDIKLRRFEQNQTTFDRFVDQGLKIKIDYREKGSKVIKKLIDMNVIIELEKLEIGDYIINNKIGIEYKNSGDFIDSLIDGRLLNQVRLLKINFERPLVVVEGPDIYSVRKVHPNAIQGLLLAIQVGFGVPIIFTRSPNESAELIYNILKREDTDKKSHSLVFDKKPLSNKELAEFIVGSLPGIGPSLAKELLKRFGSIKALANADIEDLKEVNKVGKKIAKKINEIINFNYNSEGE